MTAPDLDFGYRARKEQYIESFTPSRERNDEREILRNVYDTFVRFNSEKGPAAPLTELDAAQFNAKFFLPGGLLDPSVNRSAWDTTIQHVRLAANESELRQAWQQFRQANFLGTTRHMTSYVNAHQEARERARIASATAAAQKEKAAQDAKGKRQANTVARQWLPDSWRHYSEYFDTIRAMAKVHFDTKGLDYKSTDPWQQATQASKQFCEDFDFRKNQSSFNDETIFNGNALQAAHNALNDGQTAQAVYQRFAQDFLHRPAVNPAAQFLQTSNQFQITPANRPQRSTASKPPSTTRATKPSKQVNAR